MTTDLLLDYLMMLFQLQRLYNVEFSDCGCVTEKALERTYYGIPISIASLGIHVEVLGLNLGEEINFSD
jgi:hypothetical protein